MATLDFPANPNIGDTYTNGETIWTFDGTKWVAQAGLGLSLGYTGSRGTTGFTGSQGANGFTGSQGATGFTGSRGTTGFTGSQGATGFTGSKGDIGYTGSQGSDFGAPENKAASWSVTNSDKGKVFVVDTDNLTLTLPDQSTLDADWHIRLYTKGNGFQPSYGIPGDLRIDPQYSTLNQRLNNNTEWIMKSRQGGILFKDPEQPGNFIFDTHSTNWDIDINSTANANRAKATGWGSIAVGGQAAASGNSSISLGYVSAASGADSVAIGGNSAQATGNGAVALGNARAGGSDSFATAINSNSTSYGALCGCSIAIGPNSKANGPYGIAIGWANIAGNRSVVIGGNSTNAGDNSVGIGTWQSDINGAYSAAIGGGKAHDHNVQNRWMYSLVSSPGLGKAQAGKFVLYLQTTDDTQSSMKTNSSPVGGNNQIILGDNNMTWAFTGQIVARSTNQTDYAIWEVKGSVTRGASALATAIDVAIINPIYHTAGAAAWAVSIDADTTNAAVQINVTGESATTIRWVANIDTTEVGT